MEAKQNWMIFGGWKFKKGLGYSPKPLLSLVGDTGFEPVTSSV